MSIKGYNKENFKVIVDRIKNTKEHYAEVFKETYVTADGNSYLFNCLIHFSNSKNYSQLKTKMYVNIKVFLKSQDFSI